MSPLPLAIILLLLLLTFNIALGLECYTCEGKCGCRSPRLERCAEPHSKCYTISSLMGSHPVLRKGCSPDCLDVDVYSQNCRMCRGELCNDDQSLAVMNQREWDECGPLTKPGPQFPVVRSREERQQPAGYGMDARGGYKLGQGTGIARETGYEIGSGIHGPRPNQPPPPPQQAYSANSNAYYGSGGGAYAPRAGYDSVLAPSGLSGGGAGVSVGGEFQPQPYEGRPHYPPPSPQGYGHDAVQRSPNGPHFPHQHPYGVGGGAYYNGAAVVASAGEKLMALMSAIGLLAPSRVFA